MLSRLLSIFIILILFFLIGYIYLHQDNKQLIKESIKVPVIVIPKKSIEFVIEKNRDNHLSFIGKFNEEKTPHDIMNLLNNKNLLFEIEIIPTLKKEEDVLVLLNKLLSVVQEGYSEWFIRYKDRKLLIDGFAKEKRKKEAVDNLLAYSTVNSFNNIKVIKDEEALDVINNLKKALQKEKSINNRELLEKEIETIISNLEKVALVEKSIKNTMTKKEFKKRREIPCDRENLPLSIKRKKKIVNKVKIVKKDKIVKNDKKRDEKSINEATYYQSILEKNIPDEEIMALPMVETVDMEIEDKISQGVVEALKTTKPLVKEETIYLPSKEEKIDKSIPWANLYDTDENLDGIVLDEVIVSPETLK